MEWFEEWFGLDYRNLYSHRNDEEAIEQVAFVNSVLHLNSFSSVCDIACGDGRHSIALSAFLPEVVGIDLSKELLEIARSKPVAPIGTLKFVRADMRSLPFETSSFDLICNFFTGFGYFETDDEHISLLREWARVCKTKAALVLDYLNRDFVIENLVSKTEEERPEAIYRQERALSSDGLRIEKKITIIDKVNTDNRVFRESVRMYSVKELSDILRKGGFKVKDLFGDHDGSDFSPDSPRLLCFSQRDG